MSLYLDDPDFQLWNGNVLDVLPMLEAESVHCVVTSPPYWGLRDYGTNGQLGLESTPDAYIENMVAVFREVRRVLRSDGTCWVNMGDSYANTNGIKNETGNTERKVCPYCDGETTAYEPEDYDHSLAKEDLRNEWATCQGCDGRGWIEEGTAFRSGRYSRQRAVVPSGMKAKDLMMIPARLALALQADGWYLRSQIVWSKPNPMPESVTDRPTTAHEYIYLLSKSPRYFFDQEAVREPHKPESIERQRTGLNAATANDGFVASHRLNRDGAYEPNGAGRNIRSVWEIPTQPYPDAHFATYPEELVRRCILAGTSERGCCPECGAPWEREVERELRGGHVVHNARPAVYDQNGAAASGSYAGQPHVSGHYKVTTLGWRPTCVCSEPNGYGLTTDDGRFIAPPTPCTVLDPFCGSGTTALVARKHGRRTIGIELSREYCELASRRLQQLSLLAEAG